MIVKTSIVSSMSMENSAINILLRYFELTNKRVFTVYAKGETIKIKKSQLLGGQSIVPQSVIGEVMNSGSHSNIVHYCNNIIKDVKLHCSVNKIDFFKQIIVYLNNKK